MKGGPSLWMLLAQLRQTKKEKDEAEVLCGGGGEAARGKSAQHPCAALVLVIQGSHFDGNVSCDVWAACRQKLPERAERANKDLCVCLCV